MELVKTVLIRTVVVRAGYNGAVREQQEQRDRAGSGVPNGLHFCEVVHQMALVELLHDAGAQPLRQRQKRLDDQRFHHAIVHGPHQLDGSNRVNVLPWGVRRMAVKHLRATARKVRRVIV